MQESGEMYLETIYVLTKNKKAVRSVDVSEHMGYSKPSVSRAVGILKKGGYIHMDKDGYLLLTETGAAIAEKMYERHTVLTKILTALGVDPGIAAEDACRIEHVISDASFDAMKAHLLRAQNKNN